MKNEIVNPFVKLSEKIESTNSYLCAGLDPDGIPPNETIYWLQRVIDILSGRVSSFKPNLSFYQGSVAKENLATVMKIFRPDELYILDIKAGDIGNTQKARAKDVQETYNPDFVTITEYMGGCAEPFEELGMGTFVVGKSSNDEGVPFQERFHAGLSNSEYIATQVAPYSDMRGLVVGAGEDVEGVRRIRCLAPNAYFLMPGGIGPQAKEKSMMTLKYVNNKAIVNASRGLTGAPKHRGWYSEKNPNGIDWRGEEYAELLIKRADKLNALINSNIGFAEETWGEITIDGMIKSGLALVSGTEKDGRRAFKYKNGGTYTTYTQVRHLCGVKARIRNAAVHLIANTVKKEWENFKPDVVMPVMMGAIGLQDVADAFNAPYYVLRPEEKVPSENAVKDVIKNYVSNSAAVSNENGFIAQIQQLSKKKAGNKESLLGKVGMPADALVEFKEQLSLQEVSTFQVLIVEDIFSSGGSSIETAKKVKQMFEDMGEDFVDVRIVALATNKLEAIVNIEEAGFESLACLDIPDIAKAILPKLPKLEQEVVRKDIAERFDVEI